MTETFNDQAEALLLDADKTYGINAGPEAVREALNDDNEGSPFAQWAIQYLQHGSLLTPDELAIYMALDSGGQVDELSAANDLTQTSGVSEDELRIATDELRRSTEAIQKQTDVLQLQHQALDRLIQKRKKNETQRKDLETVQHRKIETERKHLIGEVESLSYSIEQQLKDIAHHGDSLPLQLKDMIRESLQSDDKLLSSLQKLSREIHQQGPDDTETIDHMREISLRLIKTTVETVRTRLDRIYLEALVGAAYQHANAPPTSTEIKELGDEVESLYSEILPVAQMSVEQQRLDPAIQGVSARDGQSLHRSAAALTYISNCLDHLQERTDSLSSHVATAATHGLMSETLVARARQELQVSTSPPRSTRQEVPASPVRRPSPVRNQISSAKLGSRRRSSGIMEIPALDALQEAAGVHIPDEVVAAEKRSQYLGQVLAERMAKRDDIAKNAQDSYEALTTSHLDDVRTAVQLIKDSALAETSFRDVKLVDPDFESSIDLLRKEVEEAQETLSRLELKHINKKSEQKDNLLQRWAS